MVFFAGEDYGEIACGFVVLDDIKRHSHWVEAVVYLGRVIGT